MSKGYKLTYAGCLIGTATQALVTNLTAILFVPFMELYGFELWQLAVMIGVNFASQLVADVTLTAIIDKASHRALMIAAQIITTVGLAAFALMPFVIPSGALFGGMLVCTVLFAFAGGMQEVLISPMVDAISTDGSKSFAMSLLHSFYAWGQVIIIVVISLFLKFFGYDKWYVIVLLWAVLPIVTLGIFTVCPVSKREKAEDQSAGKTAFNPIMLLCMLAIFLGGGAELIVNQYVSTYCTLALGFEKSVADIVCMGLFAACMGLSRVVNGVISKKVDMSRILIVSAVAAGGLYLVAGLSGSPLVSMIACILCGISVAMLWPGVLTVAADAFPKAGAFVFAILAVSGDLGAGILPTVAGLFADATTLPLMFVVFSAVPFACALCHVAIELLHKKQVNKAAR